MDRNRTILTLLTAATCALPAAAQEQKPESAPKFDLPPGAPKPERPPAPLNPPPGDRPRAERGDRPEHPERPPGDKPPGERPWRRDKLSPEAEAMREQAKKMFEKMTPEERGKYFENFKKWMDMPAEQRERMAKFHEDRVQRAREEIRQTIEKLGLNLTDEQKKKFGERYFEERRLIEEKLRKDFEERRKPLLDEMVQKLKSEFTPQAATAEKPTQ